MSKSMLAVHSAGGVTVNDNTTSYTVIWGTGGGNATSGIERTQQRCAAAISQLKTYVRSNTTLVTTDVVVRVGGSDQTLSVAYTSGQTGEKQDTSNSFSVTSSDWVDARWTVPNDTSGAKAIIWHSLSVLFDTDDDAETCSLFGATGTSASFSTASTSYYWCGGANATSSTTELTGRILRDYTMSDLSTYVASNARTTDTTFRSRINAADGNQLVTYTSGQTGAKEDTSNSDSLSSGDDISVVMTTGTGTGAIVIHHCVSWLTSGEGRFELIGGNTAGMALTTTNRYGGIVGHFTATSTEANAQDRIGRSAYLTDFRAYVSANTATADSVVAVRVEGASSALSVTYTTGQTGLKTDTDTVAVADDNQLGYIYSRGTSGTLTITSLAVTGWAPLIAAGIASTLALGTHSLAVALTGSGVASTIAIGTAEIRSVVALYATGIASTAAAGTPSLAGSLTASGIASGALGTPALTSASTASGIASTSALGTPNLDASIYASGIASTAAAGTPGLTVALGASGIASTSAAGTPWLDFDLSVAGIASTATIPTPALAVALGASGIAATSTVPTPGLAASLGASGIASGAALGTPGIWSAATVSGIASTEAWGTPTLSVQLYAEGIASTLVVGSHRRSLVDAAGTATIDRSLAAGVTLSRTVEDDATIDRALVGGVTITDSAAGAVTLARSLTGTVSGG